MDQLSIVVADDGRGFDVSTTIRGDGLTNMEDRLDAWGGTLRIASSPGTGTLHLIVPVAAAPRPRGQMDRFEHCYDAASIPVGGIEA